MKDHKKGVKHLGLCDCPMPTPKKPKAPSDKEAALKFGALLAELKIKAMQLGLWKTFHAIDETTKKYIEDLDDAMVANRNAIAAERKGKR